MSTTDVGRVCGENRSLRRRVGWEEMSREMRNMGVGNVWELFRVLNRLR